MLHILIARAFSFTASFICNLSLALAEKEKSSAHETFFLYVSRDFSPNIHLYS